MPLRKLYLELTSRCNLDCSMCYRRTWSDGEADMPPGLYESVKRQLLGADAPVPGSPVPGSPVPGSPVPGSPATGSPVPGSIVSETTAAMSPVPGTTAPASPGTLVLGGIGEPSVSPHFLDALQAFGGPGRELIVTSNAADYDSTMIEAVASRVDLFMASIDGMDGTYGRIRGTALGDTVATLRRINDLRAKAGLPGSNIGIQFVLSRDNMADAPALLDLAVELRARLVVISHLLPQTPEQDARVLYSRVADPEVQTLFAALASKAWRRGLSLQLPRLELKTERYCSFIENDAAVVTAGGQMAPCYRLAHDYPEYVFGRRKDVLAHSFGDATRSSLHDIWNDPGYSAFRRGIYSNRYPSCFDCDLVEGCDLVRNTSADCHASSPSCADCPWSRGFTLCP